MKSYQEHTLVQKCLQEIEDKLGWGNSNQWHNDVFIELSDVIRENTQILLSPTTLKRVWGRITYKSAPSISTLNTLAQFAEYENWRDFKNKNDIKKPSWIAKKIAQNMGIIVITASIMTIVFISFYSMIGSKKDTISPANLSKIVFSSKPITQGLPNSVVFDFDLNDLKSNSIYIQQYWDKTKTIKIKPSQNQATGIYYFPGYFGAKLLVDGEIIREHDLFIRSNGWVGTVEYKPIPKYINQKDLFGKHLSMPSSIIEEIKSNENPIISSFHLVDDFKNISGDNISIRTSVRNLYRDKWAVCQSFRIVVLGTSGAMVIPFSIPGCVSNINLMLNDIYLKGKEHDLSAFGADFSTFRIIDIMIKEKKVSVYIDNLEIYTQEYNEPIGNFVGIRYKFLGAGEVDFLKINQEPKGQTILYEDFDIDSF
ncbi:hypothetical protein U6A24_13495 [Aquimarina gracilis]|uniref:FecR family protein n=1 Tax=Aquimarina gracilis TaxID=874422 RepID=A0ABU5ZX92_9FLAO|nr:hypothetical protein [Aquimarina gracilis]MEB3346486.1 hypothetical protein [Aquimarina gracilis]